MEDATAANSNGTSAEVEIKRYTYKSGAVYEGTFDGNKRSGRGHWKHPSGEVYEGEYADNKCNGLGVYKFPNAGKCYAGHWANGKMNGEGIYFFNVDATAYFHGNYTNDAKDGSGHYLYENGVMTTQQWDMGKLVTEVETTPVEMVKNVLRTLELYKEVRAVASTELGEVPPASEVRTFQFRSGATYTGQYSGTKKHGNGFWLHPEGDSYEGQYEDNKHHVWGVYIIGRTGKKYVGQWMDGKMNGIGVYFFNPQETQYFVGRYVDDVKCGRGLYHFSNGDQSVIQIWDKGTLKQETPADAEVEKEYTEAMRMIIDTVKPFAPNYESIAVSSANSA